jgi:carbon storage regulator
MLILTRRPDETVVIGNNIRVRVMGVNGNQVRIGIDAPKDIEVRENNKSARVKSACESSD